MLKDISIDVDALNEEYKDKGIDFFETVRENPINGSKLQVTIGVVNPLHPAIQAKKLPISTKPIRLMFAAHCSTGIYMGFPLHETIRKYSKSEVVSRMVEFDLSTGMWYDSHEVAQSFNEKELPSGKAPADITRLSSSYGLADNIKQIIKHYRKVINRSDFNVVLHITYNNEKQLAGLRWHKCGKYLGKHKQKHEYLEEDNIKSILQFHLYVLKED